MEEVSSDTIALFPKRGKTIFSILFRRPTIPERDE
jgi:hypothetical protein